MTWPMVELGELVTIKGGGTPSKSIDAYWGGDVPWASVKDFKSRYINQTQDCITQAGVENSATNIIPEGVIVIPTRMALGKVAITACDMAINQDLKALFVNDECTLDRNYLARYLESKANYIESEGKGATVKGITLDFLKSIKVPLPPLAEQKRIAAILDKADAIRQKRQQAIALADQFLRSVFLDMFGDPVTNPKGWEMQPISKVAEVQGGLQVTKKREGLPVTCPYLRVANVYRGHLELSEVKTMQVTDAELERVSLVKDDILVVEGHGNKEEIGRCAMWDGSIENIIHQNHLIRVRVTKNRVLPQYLTDFINSEGGRTQLIGASNTTSGLNTISTRLVKETEVLIPDLQTQERYVHIFNKVKEALRCFQKGALGCTELFETVSQKAFSGQL